MISCNKFKLQIIWFFRIEFYSSVSLAGKCERTEKLGQNGPEEADRKLNDLVQMQMCRERLIAENFVQNIEKMFLQKLLIFAQKGKK